MSSKIWVNSGKWVLLGVLAVSNVQASVIDTFPAVGLIGSFGERGSSYFAQSFVALPGLATNLTFELRLNEENPTLGDTKFRVLVTDVVANPNVVDPTSQPPVIPANLLFESGDLALASDGSGSAPVTFSIDLGGLPPIAGTKYAFILDSYVLWDGIIDSNARIGSTSTQGDTYPEGEFFFLLGPAPGATRSDNFASPHWRRFTLGAGDSDVAFRLSFSDVTVPEPATLALFGLGLAGLGFSRRTKV